jgi:hypothetical protein
MYSFLYKYQFNTIYEELKISLIHRRLSYFCRFSMSVFRDEYCSRAMTRPAEKTKTEEKYRRRMEQSVPKSEAEELCLWVHNESARIEQRQRRIIRSQKEGAKLSPAGTGRILKIIHHRPQHLL